VNKKRQDASGLTASSSANTQWTDEELSATPKTSNRARYLSRKKKREEKDIPKLVAKYSKKEWTAHEKAFMEKHGPQSGLPSTVLSDLYRITRSFDNFPPATIAYVERVVLSVYLLSKASDVPQALAQITLFLNDMTGSSVALRAKDFLSLLLSQTNLQEMDDLPGCNTANRNDDCDAQSGSVSYLLDALNSISENWSLIRDHPLKKHICLLCTALVSAGVCSSDKFDWTVGKVRIFSGIVQSRFLNAKDLLDAVLEVLKYTLEAGITFFKTGDWHSLFVQPAEETLDMETELIFLETSLQHVRAGRLKEFTGLADNDYLRRVEKAHRSYDALYRAMPRGPQRVSVEKDLVRLTKVRETFRGIKLGDAQRMCPFGIKIDGSSGVGKSLIMNILVRAVLKAYDLDASDEVICFLSGNDKFDSNYRSDHNAAILDDAVNTKKDFVHESPLWQIIRFVNNQPETALKADVELKGIVPLLVQVFGCTTNVEDLDVEDYTNAAASILRRFGVHITMSVRPEFQATDVDGKKCTRIDPERVNAHYTNADGVLELPEIQDVQDFDVYEYVEVDYDGPPKTRVIKSYFEYNGKPTKKLNVYELIDFVIIRALLHKKNQDIYLENHRNRTLTLCEGCKRPQQVCKALCLCNPPIMSIPPPMDVQSGVRDAFSSTLACVKSKTRRAIDKMDMLSLEDLCQVYETRNAHLYYWLGERVFSVCDGTILQGAATLARDVFGDRRLVSVIGQSILISIVLLFVSLFFPPMLLVLIMYWTITLKILKEIEVEVVESFRERGHVYSTMRESILEKTRRTILIGGITASMMLGIVILVKKYYERGFVPQGNINPASQKEIDERDKEKVDWAESWISPLPGTQKQRAQTIEQAVGRLKESVVFLSYCPVLKKDIMKEPGPMDHEMVAWMPDSCKLILPWHAFFPENNTSAIPYVELRCYARFREDGKISSQMLLTIPFSRVSHANGTDLCLAHVPRIGSRKSLWWMLPSGPVGTNQARMVTINKKGERSDFNCHVEDKIVKHKMSRPFQGGMSVLPRGTSVGLCVSPLVSTGRANQIVGFHVAGRTGTPVGMYALYTQEMYELDLERLNSLSNVVNIAQEGEIMDPQVGVPIMQVGPVHPKCPTQFLTDKNVLKVFGPCVGRSSARSSMLVTPISPLVEEIFDAPRLHDRPPEINHWRHYQRWTAAASTISGTIPIHLLDISVNDYMRPLVKKMWDYPLVRKEIRPLTIMESLVGRDGVRFIDRMPFSTSVGFPEGGPKSRVVKDADPEKYPGFSAPVELDQKYLDEYDRCNTLLRSGVRVHAIFSAHLKDEPVKIGKDKVRVFNAVNIVFSMLVRTYYLPVLRFISLFPLDSECCVGLNVEGPEWDTFVRHIEKFGADRCFGLDYKGYDTTVPVEVTEAMLSIMINFARMSGNYSEDDLRAMSSIATEVMFPTVALNGTLIELMCVWISGINLTAHGGSIQNSLLLRSFFYGVRESVNLSTNIPFRSVVAAGTLGDDLKSTVKRGHDYFNMKDYHDWLLTKGMETTMPDKTAEIIPFMMSKDCDFLKRITTWDEERGVYVAALDEESIFKRLHVIRSPTDKSMDEQIVENIGTCMRDWAFYPREIYNTRQMQMYQLLARSGYVVPDVRKHYSVLIAEWLDKYMAISTDSSGNSDTTISSL